MMFRSCWAPPSHGGVAIVAVRLFGTKIRVNTVVAMADKESTTGERMVSRVLALISCLVYVPVEWVGMLRSCKCL
jgi:hypothetical protein